MQVILEVENLTKIYPKEELPAVDHISFSARTGEIVGFLGPNGAGKTTTIQMLLSLLSPTQGRIKIFGKDLEQHREEVLSQMNFVGPYASLPYNLSPKENLLVFAYLYGVRDAKNRVKNLIEEFQLSTLQNHRTGGLSSGEQTRLAVAKALLNKPKLLLLDEPTASLDPANAKALRSRITNYVSKTNSAVLWTSHNMQEVEQMCDRVVFLAKGKVIADDTPANIRKQFQKKDLEELFIALAEETI
ncbi:MAG: ABC transporter ATP-binding protein [bacterium]|nr:ABC transporter ATP-binding protein [bacterium]